MRLKILLFLLPLLLSPARALDFSGDDGLVQQCHQSLRKTLGGKALGVSGKSPVVRIIESDSPDAFVANKREIYITRGMLRLVEDSDELTFLMLHEMAHQQLDHELPSGFLDGESFLQRELAADELALQVLGETASSIDAASTLLTRLSKSRSSLPYLQKQTAIRLRNIESLRGEKHVIPSEKTLLP